MKSSVSMRGFGCTFRNSIVIGWPALLHISRGYGVSRYLSSLVKLNPPQLLSVIRYENAVSGVIGAANEALRPGIDS